MKPIILKYFTLTFLFIAFVVASNAQQINRISSKCPHTNSTYDEISAAADGNIYYAPCAGFSSIFTGGVDFSGATIIGTGFITGTGTTNAIPKWLSSTSQGNSRINDTGSNIQIGDGAGGFAWGFATTNFSTTANGFILDDAGNENLTFNGNSQTASLVAGQVINIDSGAGTTTIGDVNNVGNGTTLTVFDTSSVVELNLGGNGWDFSSNGFNVQNAGSAALGRVSSPFTSVFIGNNTNNSAQLTGTFTGNRVTTFPDASGTVLLNSTLGSTVGGSTTSFLASNYTNATAGLTNTALSVPVTTGVSYRFTLNAYVADSVAAEGGQIDFGGGSATVTSGYIAGSNSVLITSTTTTPTTVFSNATITGTNMITISGFFNCTGTGTFIVRAAQVSHVTGTLTMNAGSNLVLTRLN